MKQEILTRFPWPWLPSLALLIFFIFFIGLIAQLMMTSRQPLLARQSKLPLEEAEKHE